MPETLRDLARSTFLRLPASMRQAVLHARGRFAPWEDGFDFTPPVPGPGEVAGPPDFVGIGAQKAGTTWWFGLIASHPEVAHRADIHKERHFFDRFATNSFGPEDCAQYHGWFPRRAGTVTGEWTPDYLHLGWVPPLLMETAPRAQLLVLLRDPVERFGSGLAHHRGHRGALTAEVYADALVRGFYGQALEEWRRHYPPEQILVLQYERCVQDPWGELERTYQFLGLPPFRPDAVTEHVNKKRTEVALPDDACRRLREVYAPDVMKLVESTPDVEPSLWPNFSRLVRA
ncbi:MAG TPA: sulfotransferase [Acidimicrobiales bacterium]|nr:sulfotransferase [Acidimicrobiales bacterium]